MNFVTLSYLQKFFPSHKVQTPFVTARVQSTEISNVRINVSHVYSMKIIFMLYSVRLVSFLSPVQDPQSGLLHSSQVALSFTCFSSNLNIHIHNAQATIFYLSITTLYVFLQWVHAIFTFGFVEQ